MAQRTKPKSREDYNPIGDKLVVRCFSLKGKFERVAEIEVEPLLKDYRFPLITETEYIKANPIKKASLLKKKK